MVTVEFMRREAKNLVKRITKENKSNLYPLADPYIRKLSENTPNEFLISIPEDIIKKIRWKVKDCIQISEVDGQCLHLDNLTKRKFSLKKINNFPEIRSAVRTISKYRGIYYIRVPANIIEKNKWKVGNEIMIVDLSRFVIELTNLTKMKLTNFNKKVTFLVNQKDAAKLRKKDNEEIIKRLNRAKTKNKPEIFKKEMDRLTFAQLKRILDAFLDERRQPIDLRKHRMLVRDIKAAIRVKTAG